MAELFLSVLNISITASYLVLAVVALRLLLKKAPRWVFVLLWGIVAIRLFLPFSIKSVLSLVPSAETVSPEIMLSPTPTINSGFHAFNATINPVISEAFAPTPNHSVNPMQALVSTASSVWLVGMGIMLLYAVISYWRLHRKVATAILEQENIFRSEQVASPFVLGIFRPRIYLPSNLSDPDTTHIIAHEQAHIRRRDHWWKPLGFLLLMIHWFNPLMWLAYTLLCRDIELACDEKVIKALGADQRADYSETLLKCSVSRRSIAACPLAFGEVGVKERVKKVLNYKKPAFWIISTAIVACIIMAICFLTDPVNDPQETPGAETDPVETTPSVIIWYEHENPEYNQNTTWQLDAFPGVTFRLNNGGVEAEVNGEVTKLFSGPISIRHIYVSDINGDSYPEICADCKIFTSGIFVPDSIFVYDYANQASYTLGLPSGHSYPYAYAYDFSLRVENGQLLCDKTKSFSNGDDYFLTGQLAIVETAEGGMLYLKPFLTEEYPMAYVFQTEELEEAFILTVCADGTCQFMFSPTNNYLGLGTYTIANGKLTIQTIDRKYTYVFQIVDTGLQFLAEESSPLSPQLYDGAILIKTPIPQRDT